MMFVRHLLCLFSSGGRIYVRLSFIATMSTCCGCSASCASLNLNDVTNGRGSSCDDYVVVCRIRDCYWASSKEIWSMTCSLSRRSYLNLTVGSVLFGGLGTDSDCGGSCSIAAQDYKIC